MAMTRRSILRWLGIAALVIGYHCWRITPTNPRTTPAWAHGLPSRQWY